jgi:hypothetical protein
MDRAVVDGYISDYMCCLIAEQTVLFTVPQMAKGAAQLLSYECHARHSGSVP